jgi:hypothetical protein
MLIKVDVDVLEAVLSIISVYRGQRAPGCHFDGRDRHQVAAFYAVRIANLENAARDNAECAAH